MLIFSYGLSGSTLQGALKLEFGNFAKEWVLKAEIWRF